MESVFSSTPIKVLSLNTQNANTDVWEYTKNNNIAKCITASGADIIALQECTANGVVANIKNKMTNKNSFEVIEYNGIGPALIYNKDKFTCEASGYWTLGLKGENSSNYDRHAVYAKLKRVEDGAVILAVATHYDYNSTAANAQTETLLSLINENFGGIRSIIMGDFNVMRPNGVFTKHEKAGYIDAQSIAETKVNEDAYTFKDSDDGTEKVLDFIYLKGFKVTVHEVKTDLDGKSVSDHRPVYAEIVIK